MPKKTPDIEQAMSAFWRGYGQHATSNGGRRGGRTAAGVAAVVELMTRTKAGKHDDHVTDQPDRMQPARVPEGWRARRLAEIEDLMRGGDFAQGKAAGIRSMLAEFDSMLAAEPAPEAVITAGVAAHIKGRIDSLSPANNLSRFLDYPAPPTAEPMADWSRRMADKEAGQYVGAGSHGLEHKPGDGRKGIDVMIAELDRSEAVAADPKISRRNILGRWAIRHAHTIRRLANTQQAIEDETIACDVKVAPATTFVAGVNLSTVITSIRLRAEWEGKPFRFPNKAGRGGEAGDA